MAWSFLKATVSGALARRESNVRHRPPPMNDLRFEFSFIRFQKPQARLAKRHRDRAGDPIGRWTLSAPAGDWSIIVPASAWIGSRISLRLRFNETISPKQLGLSDDPRALGIKLQRVCISPP